MGYPASAMGTQLRAYVEHQFLTDLQFYGVPTVGFSFDWSNPCQEGHVTRYLDGMLEEMSDVGVNRADARPVAEGWLDFIHGGGDAPLFVFWLFLRLRDGDAWRKVKGQATIPRHVWERLSDHSRDVCTSETTYDARWSGTLWLLDGDVHAVNPPKLDPYERSQVAAKTRGRQCHLRCSVNRLCHASGIAW